jgi:hypothetical protein
VKKPGLLLIGNVVWALSIHAKTKKSIGMNQDLGNLSLISSFLLLKSVLYSVCNTSHPQLDQELLRLSTQSDACSIVVPPVCGTLVLVDGCSSNILDRLMPLFNIWMKATSMSALVSMISTVLKPCLDRVLNLTLNSQYAPKELVWKESRLTKKKENTKRSKEVLLPTLLFKPLKIRRLVIQ